MFPSPYGESIFLRAEQTVYPSVQSVSVSLRRIYIPTKQAGLTAYNIQVSVSLRRIYIPTGIEVCEDWQCDECFRLLTENLYSYCTGAETHLC